LLPTAKGLLKNRLRLTVQGHGRSHSCTQAIFSTMRLAEHCLVQGQICNKSLELGILFLKLLQPSDLCHAHSCTNLLPAVKRGIRDTRLPADISNRSSCLGPPQGKGDLFVCIALPRHLSTPLFKDSCPIFRTAIGSVSRIKTSPFRQSRKDGKSRIALCAGYDLVKFDFPLAKFESTLENCAAGAGAGVGTLSRNPALALACIEALAGAAGRRALALALAAVKAGAFDTFGGCRGRCHRNGSGRKHYRRSSGEHITRGIADR
jgi:hypothetical protein